MDDSGTSFSSFTGERFLPEVHGNIELEHIHRYLFACRAVVGKSVLDIASGEGYGSAMLAKIADKVVGVDISGDAILNAQKKYGAENLEFRLGSCQAIPVEDASIDVVVSFETIEHHSEHDAMMREIKRVLRPGGVVVISSPDKLEYSDRPNFHNPYHVKELYRGEFERLLGTYFSHQSLYGQRVLYGSAIFLEGKMGVLESYELNDTMLGATPGVPHATYLIAVASNADIPPMASGIFEQPVADAELVRKWIGMTAHLESVRDELTASQADLRREIARVKSTLSWRVTKPLRATWNLLRWFRGAPL